jgi:hypothetical protein
MAVFVVAVAIVIVHHVTTDTISVGLVGFVIFTGRTAIFMT